MTTQTNTSQPAPVASKPEAEPDINMGTLAIAMTQADAAVETFRSPHDTNAHRDQVDFHRAEIAKLRRNSDVIITERTNLSNRISVARSELKHLFETADAALKERERENQSAKAGELADIKKSASAHNAALQVLSPGASDNVETFRAVGSTKVS